MPAVAILGLIGYHNERKDKDFLLLQTKDAIALFRVEYLLIGFPFILIECLRSRFPEAGAMIVTSLLLPKLKAIKWKSIAFPLPFLYKGGLEYLWGIERSGFFNGREKWAKGFENQRV